MASIKRDDMRFLAVGAHPDDLESGAGGLMSLLVDQGWQGTYVVCTDGSKGARSAEEARDLAARRAAEQEAAARRIGVSRVITLGYVDGELVSDLNLRRDLVRVIREVKPHLVITWDPGAYWFGDYGMNHPDHRAAGEATCYAVYPAARNAMTFPELLHEGYPRHLVDELWLFGSNAPNAFLDISIYRAKKLEALAAHQSQAYTMQDRRRRRAPGTWLVRHFDNPLTRRLRETPEAIEAFHRVVIEHEVVSLDPAIFYDEADAD